MNWQGFKKFLPNWKYKAGLVLKQGGKSHNVFTEVSHCPRQYLIRASLKYNSELLSSDRTCSVLLSDTAQNCYLLITLALFSSQVQLRTAMFLPHLLSSSLKYNSELLSSDPTSSVLLSGTTQNYYLLILLPLFFLLSDTTQNCYLLILRALFSQVQIRTAIFWPHLLSSSLKYNSELLFSEPTCYVLFSGTNYNCYLLTPRALFVSQIQLRTAIVKSYLLCSLRFGSSSFLFFSFLLFFIFLYKITHYAASTTV
jgi:hypothetical protein